jgi:hypothetical protein
LIEHAGDIGRRWGVDPAQEHRIESERECLARRRGQPLAERAAALLDVQSRDLGRDPLESRRLLSSTGDHCGRARFARGAQPLCDDGAKQRRRGANRHSFRYRLGFRRPRENHDRARHEPQCTTG